MSKTQKSAEADDGINYLTVFSIHHQVIDGANLLSLCTQDPSAFKASLAVGRAYPDGLRVN